MPTSSQKESPKRVSRRKSSQPRNKDWPDGILKRVSREAYDAVCRARGFSYMTPREREAAAKGYTEMQNSARRTARTLKSNVRRYRGFAIVARCDAKLAKRLLGNIPPAPHMGNWVTLVKGAELGPSKTKWEAFTLGAEWIDSGRARARKAR